MGINNVCRYDDAHEADGVRSVTMVNCGPDGMIPACQPCADFYAVWSMPPDFQESDRDELDSPGTSEEPRT